MLLSKEELSQIRSEVGSRTAQYQNIVPRLLRHIAALQAVVDVLEAEVQDAWALAKKAPSTKAPATKAPAKKAPSKKAPAKKK